MKNYGYSSTFIEFLIVSYKVAGGLRLADIAQIENSALKSAKRTKNERIGVHGWHPYYAGYAERFVESAIEHLSLTPGQLVLDPWNGSGTTALVAQRRGIAEIGLDVNPVMNIFSTAKNAYLTDKGDNILAAARDAIASAKADKTVIADEDPLLDFMSPSLCRETRRLFTSIDGLKLPSVRLYPTLTGVLPITERPVHPVKAILLSCLFISARKAAGYRGGSNPTWVKTLETKPEVKSSEFFKLFEGQLSSMLEQIALVGFKPLKSPIHAAIYGDSKKIPLPDDSVDAVVTSPPYLTRIDYAMSTRPELLILGDTKSLRKTREETMGAPVIVDKTIEQSKAWGTICNSILDGVNDHPTKAARSYYLPNMLQYFRDAQHSLGELVRVLKPGCSALVVVQTSYFKEIEIPLAKIYVEMSEEMGVPAKVAFQEVVRGHMAHVNTKSSEYKKDKVFFEEVVQITKD